MPWDNGKNAKKKLFEISNGCLTLMDGSDLRGNLAKRISDDLQNFIFRQRISCQKSFKKLFPSRFFVFEEVAFWRSYEFLSITGRFLVKSYCL